MYEGDLGLGLGLGLDLDGLRFFEPDFLELDFFDLEDFLDFLCPGQRGLRAADAPSSFSASCVCSISTCCSFAFWSATAASEPSLSLC